LTKTWCCRHHSSGLCWSAYQPIRCERLTQTSKGVAGIISRTFVPVFKGEWARFLFLLVSITANKIQTADYNGVAGIIPRAIVHVFEGEWPISLLLLVSVTTNKMRTADKKPPIVLQESFLGSSFQCTRENGPDSSFYWSA
jgi:hypothetical protein